MKILIFMSNLPNVPSVVFDKMAELNKTYPSCRYGEIIHFIENRAIASSYNEIHKHIDAKSNDKIYKIMDYKDGGSLFYGFDKNGKIRYFKIIEINTSKRYMIKKQPIGEELIELPEYDCISETANLWVERNSNDT